MPVSIVIPTWCEAPRVADAVAAALRVGDEVIVADPGSPDGTAERAARAGARVVRAPRGRGAQLHAGACAAGGDTLLFLHADARLPPEAREVLLRALADPEVLGGNFRLRFEPPTAAARIFGWANDARRRYLRVYYGDSAIFLRRDCYERLGGFRPLPLFEDYDLARRLERAGRTVYIREPQVTASGRRFERRPVRTLLQWGGLQALYSLGVSPARLAAYYRDAR